jgi:hypothetical protein
MPVPDEAKGRQLLTAVERLVANNDTLRRVAAETLAVAKARGGEQPAKEVAAREVVRRYSNLAAMAGGASGLASLVPGMGIPLGIGAALAELTFLLKFEVEMTLVLMHLHGFDIEDPEERQIGFLLASVGTYEAGSGSNIVLDVARAEGVAIWNYGPRRAARTLVTVMAALAVLRIWKGLLRLVPFVGMAVGSTLNKVLTRRVGDRVNRDLKTRHDLLRRKPRPAAKKTARPRRRPKAARAG